METFDTPFAYFVSVHWKWFLFGLIIYFIVFAISHWKILLIGADKCPLQYSSSTLKNERMGNMKKLLLSSAAVLGTVSAFAEGAASVTLPDVGVDVSGYATQAISTLGGVVGVCVAGTIAFYLVRAGLRWVRGIR